ncbi:V-set domain containing T-cell activation inhibitor 1-like [Lithobates pipiens]
MIQELVGECADTIQELVRECADTIQELVGECADMIQELVGEFADTIQELVGECADTIQELVGECSNVQIFLLSSTDKTAVVASLYATVTLRCTFPFIRGREGLSVVWEKNERDGRRLIAHKFIDGRDNLKDQDLSYTGRTELSEDFSYGTADLTLREVTFNDEGTYYCRAANGKGHGDKKVDLTIGNLNAAESTVTVIHIDGKRRLKCIDIGVFRNPWVRWYNEHGADLSEHGTRTITDIGNGRKMVESVLNLDVETGKPYFCLVQEGRLKRTARAVISDGKTISVPETKLPE